MMILDRIIQTTQKNIISSWKYTHIYREKLFCIIVHKRQRFQNYLRQNEEFQSLLDSWGINPNIAPILLQFHQLISHKLARKHPTPLLFFLLN